MSESDETAQNPGMYIGGTGDCLFADYVFPATGEYPNEWPLPSGGACFALAIYDDKEPGFKDEVDHLWVAPSPMVLEDLVGSWVTHILELSLDEAESSWKELALLCLGEGWRLYVGDLHTQIPD